MKFHINLMMIKMLMKQVNRFQKLNTKYLLEIAKYQSGWMTSFHILNQVTLLGNLKLLWKLINLLKTPHNCTKYIDLRHHFVREAGEKGLIKVKYKPTNGMIVDVL